MLRAARRSQFKSATTLTTVNLVYASALAATTSGQYFGWLDDSGNVAHIYLNNAGVGVYQSTIPYNSATQSLNDIASAVRANTKLSLPATGLLVDICGIDSYFSAQGKIKNRVANAEPDFNLLGVSRGVDIYNMYALGAPSSNDFTPANTLATYAPIVDAGGVNLNALGITLPATAGSGAGLNVASLPGQWTYTFDAKASVTGIAGYMGHSYIVQALTTSWATYSITLNNTAANAAAVVWLIYATTAVAGVVSIDNVRITPGASAGLVSGAPQGVAPRQAVRGLRDMKSAAAAFHNGIIPLGNTSNFTALSYSMAVKRSEIANGNWDVLLNSQILFNNGYPATRDFSVTASAPITGNTQALKSKAWFVYGGSAAQSYSTQMVDVGTQDGYVIVSAVMGAGGARLYIDNLQVSSSATAWSGSAMKFLQLLGQRGIGTESWGGNLASLILYQAELNDAAMQNLITLTKQRMTAMGLTVQKFGSVYISEGDSIAAGSTGPTWYAGFAVRQKYRFTPTLQGMNLAVGGSSLAGAATNAALIYVGAAPWMAEGARKTAMLAQIASVVASGRRPICSVHIGTNDLFNAYTGKANGNPDNLNGSTTLDAANYLVGAGALAWYQALLDYCHALQLAGAKVVVSTILPRQAFEVVGGALGSGTIATANCDNMRKTLNQFIRSKTIPSGITGYAGAPYDAVCDACADAAFANYTAAASTAATNTSVSTNGTAVAGPYLLAADGTHPTDVGHEVMAYYMQQAITSVWVA